MVSRITIASSTVGWGVFVVGFLLLVSGLVEQQERDLHDFDPRYDAAGLPPMFAQGLYKLALTVKILEKAFMFVVYGYAAVFLISFIIVLPFIVRLIGAWRDPPKFLLLRPFNRAWISADLQATIKHELSALGHCYTLADSQIRVPLYIRVPFLLGLASFFSFRVRKIRRPKQLARLSKSLTRIKLRNVNWCLSMSKLFPISCADTMWQSCVVQLLRDHDAFVIDLSDMGGGLLWEVDALIKSESTDRCVFISRAGQEETIKAQLREQFGEQTSEWKLIAYDASKNQEQGAILDAVVGVLATSRRERSEGSRS